MWRNKNNKMSIKKNRKMEIYDPLFQITTKTKRRKKYTGYIMTIQYGNV